MKIPNTNIKNKKFPQFIGSNREKLLKLEIEMEMKDYIKTKALNSENKFSKSNYLDNYKKYENVDEKNDLVSKVAQNLLTNDIIKNIFDKKKIFTWLGIPTNFDEITHYSKWWRFYDMCITLCNFLVLLLGIYDYELNFSYPRKAINETNTVRLLMILLSIVAIYCVIKRHYNKGKWKSLNLNMNNQSSDKPLKYKYAGEIFDENEEDYATDKPRVMPKKVKLFKKGFLIDILINIIIPYPRLDFIIDVVEIDRDTNSYISIEYLFSDFLYIMIIIRMFYLIRSTINYSIFTDHFANVLAKERGVKCNVRFAIKCLIKNYQLKLVFVFFLVSNFILGYALRVFERPFFAHKQRLEYDYLINSLWLVFITMLTIGYGDFAPVTTFGRFVIVISSLWGSFICSLVIVCLYGMLDLSNDQFMVYIKIVKSRIAMKFIEDVYALKKSRLIKKKNPQDYSDNYEKMLESYTEFKGMTDETKSIYRSNGLLHYNLKLLKEMKKFTLRFDKLEFDIESLTNNISHDIKIS